jgi:microcystin-dependent protein
MALETATYINGLVPANPFGSDPIANADDHLRLIKSTLKATFPNITGPVTLSQGDLNAAMPRGGIIMWSGTTVPTGWALCNGASVPKSDGSGNVTVPNLMDRFIVGAGNAYVTGLIGGVATYALSVAQLPAHSHIGTTNPDGSHNHVLNDPNVVTNQGGVNLNGTPSTNPNTRVGDNTGASQTGITVLAGGLHAHTFSTTNTGNGAGIENRPPFYALAFIMKV